MSCGGAIDVEQARTPAALDVVDGHPKPSVAAYAPPSPSLRRLTVAQYRNTLQDLFGVSVAATELEADTVLHGFASVGASQLAFSPRATELLAATAFDVAERVFTDPLTRPNLVGCTPAVVQDDVCTREFLRRLGRKAWRRPLADAELERYTALAERVALDSNDGWKGLEYAVAGLLQSPRFLYRVELGSEGPPPSSLRTFDAFELATRLSFLMWNSTPDDALLDAAERGMLSDPAGVRGEALRLLESPRARGALENFWREMFHLGELDELVQTPSSFPLVSASLGLSMQAETLAVLSDLVFARDGDYRELFTTRSSFVNDELARLYGLAPSTGALFGAVTFPADFPRAGLLGHASVLTLGAHATRTSPTRRGKFVREVLLCQAVPAPPPNVSTDLSQGSALASQRTMREKLEVHRADAACAACHAMMDPIGLGLEHFDAIGAYRATDSGLPIDASGELDSAPFQDSLGLGAALAAHPELATCLARSLFRYATGRLETGAEQSLIEGLRGRFAGEGFRVKTLLLALVESDGFRFAGPLD